MTSDPKRLEATVYGLVQGVGYRWYARQMARRLNLAGYVRNRYDRTVEVVAEGQEHALREFLAYLETGPSAAVVVSPSRNFSVTEPSTPRGGPSG